MDDEKLLQIADDQLNFLDRMSALHQRRMLDSIQTLERRIVDRASALKTSDSGNLLGAKTNLAQAQKVHSDMTALFDEEYGAASRETVKEYSESLPVIQQQYEEMGEAVKYTGVDRDMVKGLKSMDLAAYASYGLAAQDKIAKAIYNHVIAQAPFSALVGEITATLTGQKDKRGRPLANYAKQMANDGIMNFHNTVNLKKAEDAGFTHYLYVGNIIADSRPFCIARAGNVYTREQIDSWTGTWQGKSGPAFAHRGGYNCRHHWQPVRKEWIPEGGIEVQSWFDRAGVMPVSKLPKAVTEAPKFKAYQAWQESVLLGKKPIIAAQNPSKAAIDTALQEFDALPAGKLFDDAKDITAVFKKSKIPHNTVLTDFENGSPKTVLVNIKDIHITQPNVRRGQLVKLLNSSGEAQPIPAVKYGNEIVIHDGHHRLIREYLLGGDAVKVNLVGEYNLIGKPLDAAAVAKAAGVPKSAASGWLSQWQRGYNLPQGWQSVVRDLEAKAGGFEQVGAETLEAVPGGKKSIAALNKLTTGEQLKPTLYRGHGTTDHRTPSQFAEGTYWSPHEEVSKTYGPELITKEIELRNPYVWDLPGKKPYFIELEEHFGTKNPKKITQMLQEKGHDALVVRGVPVMRDAVTMRDSIEVIALDKPLAKAIVETRAAAGVEVEINISPKNLTIPESSLKGLKGTIKGWKMSLGYDDLPVENDAYFYHGTFLDKLPGIKEKGLIPQTQKTFEGFGTNAEVSLAPTVKDLEYWSVGGFYSRGNQSGKFFKPVILRIEKASLDSPVPFRRDEFRVKSVGTDAIEMWDGKKWIKLSDIKIVRGNK